ncbi:MAG: Thiosulfate sulfurtransferase GlpE [Methanonatronarchaeales archaeon]|nr:Thiosulfate sulfurtransferase GlpE [Methanonatronarchaeales archaeon]
MRRGYVLISAALLLFIGYSAFQYSEVGPAGYGDVTPEKAYGIIQEQDPVVLDVRTRAEYRRGHVPGAINVPVESPNELKERWSEVPEGRPVVVYCRSGRRSAVASELLTEKGYGQVYNILGGIDRWAAEGYPIRR